MVNLLHHEGFLDWKKEEEPCCVCRREVLEPASEGSLIDASLWEDKHGRAKNVK